MRRRLSSATPQGNPDVSVHVRYAAFRGPSAPTKPSRIRQEATPESSHHHAPTSCFRATPRGSRFPAEDEGQKGMIMRGSTRCDSSHPEVHPETSSEPRNQSRGGCLPSSVAQKRRYLNILMFSPITHHLKHHTWRERGGVGKLVIGWFAVGGGGDERSVPEVVRPFSSGRRIPAGRGCWVGFADILPRQVCVAVPAELSIGVVVGIRWGCERVAEVHPYMRPSIEPVTATYVASLRFFPQIN